MLTIYALDRTVATGAKLVVPDLLDSSIADLINRQAEQLEERLGSDLIFYHGSIYPQYFRHFRNFVEEVKDKSTRSENAISIVLRTGGGSAETTERMVAVLRQHYTTVNFVVPDVAMSAGTIFCMAGDKIGHLEEPSIFGLTAARGV